MMDGDPLNTQRDVGSAVVTELPAAGFDNGEEIGRGGFGIVYRCTQVDLDRTVAVKVLTAELDEIRERFLREQRAMGRLTGHPNIVSVLQEGETDSGYPYLVMQYHRQGSLEARIRRLGPLTLDEVLRLGVKMAVAVDTAHRVGILHRDVKPANILLTDYGEPALSDFGIAHITGGFTTATGTFTDSPAFTAPEILGGDPPSRSSDVYGLGATLFCALTGHAAFERRSGEQMVAQFLRIASESAPDLRESGIPEDVSAVVEKAMARDPHNRPTASRWVSRFSKCRRVTACPPTRWRWAEPDTAPRPQRARTGAHRTIGNLPLELTTFVGRRTELSEVRNMLAASRLVTLAGIGGVGKTRLAMRAASDARPDFPEGVWLVELGELHDGALLLDSVAAVAGTPGEVIAHYAPWCERVSSNSWRSCTEATSTPSGSLSGSFRSYGPAGKSGRLNRRRRRIGQSCSRVPADSYAGTPLHQWGSTRRSCRCWAGCRYQRWRCWPWGSVLRCVVAAGAGAAGGTALARDTQRV
jgi:non-specific serine/threonine protein kinase